MNNFQISFVVDKNPDEVFNLINQVDAWWNKTVQGNPKKLNDEFSVSFEDIHHSTQKITEFIPGKKVTWLVTDSRLSWLKDPSEWTGTQIIFELTKVNDGTELKFQHIGLIPEVECYGNCVQGWNYFIGTSLVKLISEGKGQPK